MIHGLLHGIKRCLLKVTREFACRCRSHARCKRGGFMGRAGIDLFIEDGAYTTLSSAVVILVVLPAALMLLDGLIRRTTLGWLPSAAPQMSEKE